MSSVTKRIRQFYINLTDKMSSSDYIYVKSKLDENEFFYFNKILKSEQKHSVRVAMDIEQKIKDNSIDNKYIIDNLDVLIKASLLHDIGKAKAKVNIIDKSIIVILNKLTKENLRKVPFKKIQCYYNHATYSYEILKDISCDTVMLDIIKNHHNKNYINNDLVTFFQQIDDNN